MTGNDEIIYDAVGNLKRLTGIRDVDFKTSRQKAYDYDVTINGNCFVCLVKTLVNKANYNMAVQQMNDLKAKTDKPLLMVAQHIVPNLVNDFQNENISVMESNGNCNVVAAPLFIHISGQKPVEVKEAKGKAFNEAGLKLIFYFMLDESNVNKPYRKISEETGVSLGTIKNVIEELSKSMYVLTTDKGRFLKNKKELLDVWQTYYNQTLKPKLFIKEMEFADPENRNHWEAITLPEGMCWGGESAAYLLDHFLVPEQFDVYTEVPCIKLAMSKKMKFQEKGCIRIYQKFWKGNANEKVAPRLLVYADLMGSGNSRCIEAAQRLIKDGI